MQNANFHFKHIEEACLNWRLESQRFKLCSHVCFWLQRNRTMHDISDDDTIGYGGNTYFLQTSKLSVVVDKTKRVTCAAPVAACIMLSCELQANLKLFTNRRRRSGVMNRCN